MKFFEEVVHQLSFTRGRYMYAADAKTSMYTSLYPNFVERRIDVT